MSSSEGPGAWDQSPGMGDRIVLAQPLNLCECHFPHLRMRGRTPWALGHFPAWLVRGSRACACGWAQKPPSFSAEHLEESQNLGRHPHVAGGEKVDGNKRMF